MAGNCSLTWTDDSEPLPLLVIPWGRGFHIQLWLDSIAFFNTGVARMTRMISIWLIVINTWTRGTQSLRFPKVKPVTVTKGDSELISKVKGCLAVIVMDLDALENKFVINSQLRKSIFCLKLDNACAHHFTFDIHSLHHNDRYISVVPPKEMIQKYEEALSHCCQSHPQSTHQAPGFSTKPTRYILSKLCLLLKSYFLTPLAGPSGVKGMFEFDKRFSGGAKNCKRKTDNIIGMS